MLFQYAFFSYAFSAEITSDLYDNVTYSSFKSQIGTWLGLASLGYGMYCHDLEVMG